MKKIRPALKLILALVLALTLLCGCGAAGDSVSNSASTAPMAPATDTAGGDYGYWNGAAESVQEDMAVSEELDRSVTGSSALANTKLIYTARLDMETTEFDAAVASLEELVGSLGGYFESSSVDNYGSYRYANYTVRVPAESFETFCETAGTLCQLNNIYRNAQDVSEYYYDTESRLATQQTKLERLQELLARAESMEDIITIESAISETELQIENLTGTLRKYDSLVGYSTIDISLCEVYTLTVVEEPVIGFGAKLVQAFQSGCTGFVKSLQRGLLSVARNWVGWLIFLVIAAVVIVVVVRCVRRRKALLVRREATSREKGSGEGT
ncbi:MAG: DUF4349 domain-containing protein [Oscillospiraceae bacterium]